MKARRSLPFLFVVGALIAPALRAQSVDAVVSSAPASVTTNQQFYIEAEGDSYGPSDNYVTEVDVDLDGQYTATTYGGYDWFYTAGGDAIAAANPGTQYVNAQAWDSYGDYMSTSQAVTVNGTNHPPSVGIAVDGHSPGDTITRPYGGSISVTVRYTAGDADGNLQGIRYNVWNATTGYFDNGGGGFVSTGGSSGEVDRTVNLDSNGDWYFWTDAQDTSGAYSSTGDWQNGFHVVVNQAPPPNSPPSSSLSASATAITYGQGITLTSRITDVDGNLANQAIDLSTDNSNWASGWSNWSGTTAWNISGGDVTDTVTYTAPNAGMYYFRSRGQDTANALSDFAYATVTVNRAQMQPPTPNRNSYSIAPGTSWSPLSDVQVPAGNGNGEVMWCVVGQTNFNTASWTPPGRGTYQFTLAQKADSNHQGNVTDPIQGGMETNGTYYTLNVTGGPVTFTFSGGPFTYDGSTKSVTVSANPSDATFTTSGTSATSAGTYTATATATGNYSGSGSYTWTINPAATSFSFSGGPNYTYDGTTKTVSVSVSPPGASYNPTGSYSAINTGSYTATATATGNYSGSANYNWSITVPSTYTLTTTVSPAGAGSVSSGGTYNNGSTATVSASASSGYVFNCWSGDAAGTAPSASIAMNADKSVTANFTAIPVIISPSTASGTVNVAFTYTIAATNSPTSYSASGLPPGLNCNATTGVISGAPTTIGTYSATIRAINGPATGISTLTITISGGTAADDNNANLLNTHVPY